MLSLIPWNPLTVKKTVWRILPPRAEQGSDESVKAAAAEIKECGQEKLPQCREMVDELMSVHVECTQKAKKRIYQKNVCAGPTDEGGKGRRQSKSRKKKDMATALPEKNARRMSISRIQCCVEGCEKRRICSKKFKKSPKCNKDFCPSHVKHFRKHTC